MPGRDTTNDLSIVAFSKALGRQREVAGVRAADFSLALNGASGGTFEVDADDSINAILQRPGARVVVGYRGKQEISGPVRKQGLGLQATDRQVYTVEDDWRHFVNTACWVVPVAAYYSQGKLDAQSLSDDAQAISTVAHDAGTNAGYGGFVFPTTNGSISAETAIKTLIQRNLIDRLGPAWQAARGTSAVPFRMATDQARGGDAGLQSKLPVPRFESIADNVAALLVWSGLRLRAYQHATDPVVVFDVETSGTFPQKITLESGILVDGTGSISGPNATRVAVGGPGDVTARDWHEVLDTTGREATWGDVIEVVKDAGNAQITWPDTSVLAAKYQVPKFYRLRSEPAAADKATYLAALNAAGAEALADGAPKSGLGVELAEAGSFYYGGTPDPATGRTGVQLGTFLNVELAARIPNVDPPTIVSRITGARIVLDADSGIASTVTVGDRTDDPDAELANALAAVQTALRRRASRK